MGSEGPKPVVIHVTGFKKFQGVAENPTETIVSNLRDFIQKRGLPNGVTLGSCIVLETAGDGALPMLYKIMESGISGADALSNEQVVWVSCLPAANCTVENQLYLWIAFCFLIDFQKPFAFLGLIIVGHVNQMD